MTPQTFKPLFGAPDDTAPIKTSPLGIRVQAHGYDEPLTPKQLRKRSNKNKNYFDSLGVPANVQNEFGFYLTTFSQNMMTWIDEAYNTIKHDRWLPCGGHYADIANRIQPSSIEITLVPAPFWVNYYKVYAVGMTDPNAHGAITLCVAAITKASPTSTAPDWLRRVDALARWEIGNYFAYRAGIKDREVGDRSPCGG